MWEKVSSDISGGWGPFVTTRMKVPRGWLVKTICFSSSTGVAIAQTFVPDDNHEWELEDKK